MKSRAHHLEAGVTIIELLVAVSVMGLLITALTGALFLGFRSTQDTHTSLDQSNTEQLLGTYVTKDIQEADQITSQATTCDGALLRLATKTSSHPVDPPRGDVTVSYELLGTDLIRHAVRASASGTATESHKIADNVTCLTANGTDTVVIGVTTSESTEVREYEFSFEVRRRQATL